ncbi:MAG: protein kinase [Terriglobia bacterium]
MSVSGESVRERFPPGALISHYRIEGLIAPSGMGEVYRAVDIRLGRVVAIKVLPATSTASLTARKRFLREARAVSLLSHPNICTIFEVGEWEGRLFIVMQYLQGKTIKQLLAEKPALPVENALSYAIDVTSALEEAHFKGVVHRDIKPSNIIVNEHGHAVVLDFGLAKLVQLPGSRDDEGATLSIVTREASILGTAPYMSPEQIRGEPVDPRSDIFSFGILLFELLGGQRPFIARSQIEVMSAILQADPPSLGKLRPEVDPPLEKIVQKALQKNPARRYGSASELKNALIDYTQEKGYLVRSIHAKPNLLSWFYAVLIIAFLVVVAWLAIRIGRRPDTTSADLKFVQLTNWKSDPGASGSDPTFSRDGKMIAFSSNREGVSNIWVEQVAGGTLFQVTRDKWEDTSPIWSPDSQQIAFVSNRGDQLGIWAIPALGGLPRLLKTVGPSRHSSERPILRTWSKDGTKIYYQFANLFALDVNSGQSTQITRLEASRPASQSFGVSANETQIAFVDRKNGQAGIWIAPTRGGNARQITSDPERDLNPVWHPDGKRIIYNSMRNGICQVFVAYVDGRTPQQLPLGDSDRLVSDISPDGTRILYHSTNEESNVWSVGLDTHKELQVTSSIAVELWPEISPDGATIAYQSTRGSNASIRLPKSLILTKAIATRGQPVQLVADGYELTWAPSGNQLAFLRDSGKGPNIWKVDVLGGEVRQLTKEGIFFDGFSYLPFNRRQGKDFSWSPDGSHIAYCSNKPNAWNVWTVSADGSSETRISNNSNKDLFLTCPLWSPDGRTIAYTTTPRASRKDAKRIRSVWLVEDEESRLLYSSESDLRLIGWLGSDKNLLIATVNSGEDAPPTAMEVDLVQISLAKAASTVLAHLRATYFHNIELSPDKQKVAYVSRDSGADDVWVRWISGSASRRLTNNSDPRIYFSRVAWSPDGKTVYFGKQASYEIISMIDNFK